jgi:hypothetical protein
MEIQGRNQATRARSGGDDKPYEIFGLKLVRRFV